MHSALHSLASPDSLNSSSAGPASLFPHGFSYNVPYLSCTTQPRGTFSGTWLLSSTTFPHLLFWVKGPSMWPHSVLGILEFSHLWPGIGMMYGSSSPARRLFFPGEGTMSWSLLIPKCTALAPPLLWQRLLSLMWGKYATFRTNSDCEWDWQEGCEKPEKVQRWLPPPFNLLILPKGKGWRRGWDFSSWSGWNDALSRSLSDSDFLSAGDFVISSGTNWALLLLLLLVGRWDGFASSPSSTILALSLQENHQPHLLPGKSSVWSQGCPRILRWKRKDGSFSDVIRERKSVRRCGQEVNEKSAALRLKYLIALFSESLGKKLRTEKSNMFIRMVVELQSCFSDEHSCPGPLWRRNQAGSGQLGVDLTVTVPGWGPRGQPLCMHLPPQVWQYWHFQCQRSRDTDGNALT